MVKHTSVTDSRSTIRVGIVGLGVGERHAASYRRTPGVALQAVCDIDPGRLADVADQLGVVERHGDFHHITEHPDIDVVSICSYDDAHVEQAVSAFRHGKHVMIEKPAALNRPDAERLLRAQQDSGRFITSNLILRQSPRFRSVKSLMDAGEFGDVFCIEGDYLHDILWKITEGWRGKMPFYCTIYGGGIHLIDLMRWVMNEEIDEVSCMGSNVLTRRSGYRYDDTFVALLRFSGGALGKCLTTFGPRRTKFHSLNVYGTKKTFVNDMPDAKLFSGDRPADEEMLSNEDERWRYPGMEKGDLIPDFIAAIREGREPDVGARDVFRVMDVCFAAREAAIAGRSVRVSYLI